MGAFDDVLAANRDYQRTFHDLGLPGRAAKGLAVVTCMDSRIDPLGMLGLMPGDAKILRSAGARVTEDVLRGLELAHDRLGVTRVMVVAHTDCAAATTRAEQEASLQRDVQRVRSSPHLPKQMPIVGGVYDVRTGAVSLTVT